MNEKNFYVESNDTEETILLKLNEKEKELKDSLYRFQVFSSQIKDIFSKEGYSEEIYNALYFSFVLKNKYPYEVLDDIKKEIAENE